MIDAKIYEWDVAREGDETPPCVVEVTRERIAEYCRAVRPGNPVYLDDDAARAAELPGIVAPPTMFVDTATVHRVRRLELAGSQFVDFPVLALALPELEAIAGTRIDGFLGFALFRD